MLIVTHFYGTVCRRHYSIVFFHFFLYLHIHLQTEFVVVTVVVFFFLYSYHSKRTSAFFRFLTFVTFVDFCAHRQLARLGKEAQYRSMVYYYKVSWLLLNVLKSSTFHATASSGGILQSAGLKNTAKQCTTVPSFLCKLFKQISITGEILIYTSTTCSHRKSLDV